MRVVIQDLAGGGVSVAEIPSPIAVPGEVVIANARSLVSAGTEKTAMDLARKSLLGKARERPDHLRRVLEKMKQEGVFATWKQVKQKLEEPMAMGYSSAGVVLACGHGVRGFQVGDRVASNGPHAEVVSVPAHLCARVPDGVSFDHAAFTVLGAISLQGVRHGHLEVGETALVVGLGLLGQLACGILAASGCRVIGTDPDPARCELALKMGAFVARPGIGAGDVEAMTGGLGADAVLIAAATSSRQPLDLAANAVRKRGRIVLLGVVDLQLDRRAFYFKETEFVVSCSYGPGRYDPQYEDRGHDYPPAFVRWTENRNFQAVLELMASGRLDVSPLITHRFPIEKTLDAYAMIEDGKVPYVGILLEYPEGLEPSRRIELKAEPVDGAKGAKGDVSVGCIGAGQFARAVLLPAIVSTQGVRPRALCSAGGLSAAHAGERHGFEVAVSDEEDVYGDASIGAVFVLTQHDLHARQVVRGLAAGKHVFVEKPLALTVEEVRDVDAAVAAAKGPMLMVGFNRRFAPATEAVRAHFSTVTEPLSVMIRFNAGRIPTEHWTQADDVGGGRIVGEACHAIDLAVRLVGSPVVRVYAESIGGPNAPEIRDDQCFITLRHGNGAVSSVAYLSGGDKAFPKERVEVFGGGRVAVIEDWRRVVLVANGKTKRRKLGRQDKGHRAEIGAFVEAVRRGGPWPIPWEEIRSVSLAAILAVRSLREGVPFDVPGHGEIPGQGEVPGHGDVPGAGA